MIGKLMYTELLYSLTKLLRLNTLVFFKFTKESLHNGNPCSEFVRNDYVLKVDKNNEITITPIKDSWSRKEVIELIRKSLVDITGKARQINSINKWIEENL